MPPRSRTLSTCSDSFVTWTPSSIASSAPIPRAKNPHSESRSQSWGKSRFESSATTQESWYLDRASGNPNPRDLLPLQKRKVFFRRVRQEFAFRRKLEG